MSTSSTKPTTLEARAEVNQLLTWDGKMEPTSPPSSELFTAYESSGNWPFEDNFANEIKYLINGTFDFKTDDMMDITPELIDGDDIVIELYDMKELKEETWSDGGKVNALTTDLLDYQTGIVTQPPNAVTKIFNNNNNDNHYETVPTTVGSLLGVAAACYETTIFTQLTPPQSPPQSVVAATPAIATLEAIKNINNDNELAHHAHHNHQQQHQHAAMSSAASSAVLPHVNFSSWDNGGHTPGGNDDIARDVQIVDDIVNIRAKELFNWDDDVDECESQSSTSALSQADSNIDEEWFPESSSYSPSSCISSLSSSSSSSSSSSASSSPTRCTSGDGVVAKALQRTATPKKSGGRASRGRGVEDRKNRKKEQNKNAATRYRQKKKIEMENVLSEEQTLAARNDELLKILADCTREQKYLKSLIREFYAHKKKK